VEWLVRRHLARTVPPTVRVTVRVGSRVPPVLFDPAHPAMAAASTACRRGFGAPPAFLRSGGTIPAAGHLRRRLGIPVVLLGLALPDDGAHAPNERFHLPNLWQGIDTLVWFLLEAAQLEPRPALPVGLSAGLRAAPST
jgi:acetylornithine deacetylase/succinyl-diaminopimelate desuccinylase-like protein